MMMKETTSKNGGDGPVDDALKRRHHEFVRVIPGMATAVLIMLIAIPIADWLGARILTWQGIDPTTASSPVSAVSIAIILGIIVRNTVAVPDSLMPGIRVSMKSLLRLGIVFVGIKLSLVEIVRLGLWGIPIVAVSIGAGLGLVTFINNRMGLPHRLGTLIAAGTGICGVTAIVSVAPAIDADEREVAYAVASITFFGLIGMLTYPYLAPILFATSEQIGLWLGVAIHDTSQVVGAALTFREVFADEIAFQAATVTKLTRNLFLIAVVPLLSFYYLRNTTGAAPRSSLGLSRLVPGFVIGFVLMAVLRTVGDTMAVSNAGSAGVDSGLAFGLWSATGWKSVVSTIGDVWGAQYLLGTAMAAVGLGTHFSVFKGVGLRPFLVGLIGALLVGLIGFVMVFGLGRFVSL